MKVKISITTIIKIYNSQKDFILFRLNDEENRIIDFVLTNDLSRYRSKYNNNFKLVTDIKKQIKNFAIDLQVSNKRTIFTKNLKTIYNE